MNHFLIFLFFFVECFITCWFNSNNLWVEASAQRRQHQPSLFGVDVKLWRHCSAALQPQKADTLEQAQKLLLRSIDHAQRVHRQIVLAAPTIFMTLYEHFSDMSIFR